MTGDESLCSRSPKRVIPIPLIANYLFNSSDAEFVIAALSGQQTETPPDLPGKLRRLKLLAKLQQTTPERRSNMLQSTKDYLVMQNEFVTKQQANDDAYAQIDVAIV